MWHDEFRPIDMRAFLIRHAPGMTKRWNQTEKTKTTQTSGFTGQQQKVASDLIKTFSPFIDKGTLGGLSDLEEKSLSFLRGADVFGPLQAAGTGLLTGTTGATPTTPESASETFRAAVSDPARRTFEKIDRPLIREEFAGPGFFGSARAKAVTERGGELEDRLSAQRAKFLFDVDTQNKQIEEAKAGRALSALGAVPQSLLSYATGTAQFGRGIQTLLNQITDPQVLQVLGGLLNKPFGTAVTRTAAAPSEFQRILNVRDAGGSAAVQALSGGGAGGAFGAFAGG